MVHLLLKSGANVNAITKSTHATPLHRAVFSDHEKVVQLLLSFCSYPNVQEVVTNYSNTGRNGDKRTFCDIFLKDSDGRTALEIVSSFFV